MKPLDKPLMKCVFCLGHAELWEEMEKVVWLYIHVYYNTFLCTLPQLNYWSKWF